MKFPYWFLLLVFLTACFMQSNQPSEAETAVSTTPPTGDSPRYPFPQHRTYAPNTIRPNHRTQAQQDDDVRAFYDHWKTNYLVAAGTTPQNNPLYRVSFGSSNPGRTVSEGQGYGMVIVALMAGYDPDAHTIFDGLWEFSRAHPSNIDSRLMAWEFPEPGGGASSAFDGDVDIAYGLLLAHAQWGSNGRINYQQAANEVIAGILESTIGPDSHLPMLGDWVDAGGSTYNQYTPRSSDFILGHFRAYGRATGNTTWNQVVSSSQAVITSLQTNHSPATGLLPDFIVPVSEIDHTPQPAPPHFLEGDFDGDYYYNAGRDPWRLGIDALLNNDPTTLTQVRQLTDWVATAAGNQPDQIAAGYYLDGQNLPNNYFTTFFVAPFGVAAMTQPTQQTWLNDIYDAIYDTHEDYYEDNVTLLCLLVMTGNFWDPTAVENNQMAFLPLMLQ